MSNEFVGSILNGNYKFKNDGAEYDYLFYGGFQSDMVDQSLVHDKDGIDYKHNKYGFRSIDFYSDTHSIFAGCSHTYGVGLRFSENWSGLLSSMMGVDHVNLGRRGASVDTIISNIFEYIRLFGKPKNIFCMFPDFERMPIFLNDKVLGSKYGSRGGYKDIQLGNLSNLDARPSFIKKPFMVEDVLPMEAPVYIALSSIRRLEQYCQDVGINLFWSSLSGRNHSMVEKLIDNRPGSYKFFVNSDQVNWIRNNENFIGDQYMEDLSTGPHGTQIFCHEEIRPMHEDTFDNALDTSPDGDIRGSHLGVHRQYHAAEKLYMAYTGA